MSDQRFCVCQCVADVTILAHGLGSRGAALSTLAPQVANDRTTNNNRSSHHQQGEAEQSGWIFWGY